MAIQVRVSGCGGTKLNASNFDFGVLFLDATGRTFVRLENGALLLKEGRIPIIYTREAMRQKCCFTDCSVAGPGVKATLEIGQAL
jgi:hypothetical protein